MLSTTIKPAIALLALLMLIACTPFIEVGKKDAAVEAPLLLETQVSRSSCVQSGDQVNIRYTVTNQGTTPFTMQAKDAPVIDLIIYQGLMGPSPNLILYSWSESNRDKIQSNLTWEPHESKVIEAVWTVPQQTFLPGTNAFITGTLRKNTKLEQATEVVLCMGVPFEPG